jgi:hypothetical protein
MKLCTLRSSSIYMDKNINVVFIVKNGLKPNLIKSRLGEGELLKVKVNFEYVDIFLVKKPQYLLYG